MPQSKPMPWVQFIMLINLMMMMMMIKINYTQNKNTKTKMNPTTKKYYMKW